MITLRPNQRRTIDTLYDWFRANPHGHPIVDAAVGAGKSIMLAQLCREAAVGFDRPSRVLMIVPSKELCEQNLNKLEALAPDLRIGVCSASLGRKEVFRDTDLIIGTIGTLYRQGARLGFFDLLMVDECFPAGTMIKTSDRDVAIESIKPGDTVITAIGERPVIAASKRMTRDLITIRLSNGKSITCTPRHPIFTQSGWRQARELEGGEFVIGIENMRSLWRGVQAEKVRIRSRGTKETVGQESLLFSEMFRTEWTKNASRSERKVYSCAGGIKKKKVGKRAKKCGGKNRKVLMLRKGVFCEIAKRWKEATVLQHILLKEVQQSDGYPRCSRSDVKNIANYWASAESTRRKRKAIDRATNRSAFRARNRMGRGSCCAHEDSKGKWVSDMLQDRRSECRHEGGNRNRRGIAQWKEKVAGLQKGLFAYGARVENVSHYESAGDVAVYNLHVSGHPSYFANGVLVHNCHLVNSADTGMFRDLINLLSAINPDIRVIGWTGTPFRGNGVWLHDGEERIFTDIAARLTMRELLDDGYLSPLVNAPTETQLSGDGLRISGGDYVIHDLAQRIDQPGITERIAAEIVKLGQDRGRWLVYGVTVAHAQHLQTALQSHGIMTGFVCGETPKTEREKVIAAFRSGRLRAVVNVAVLTTGFDLPEVDLLALVRNTRSPVLAVQIAGRGMRIAEGKRDCLWCDFTDTTARLGPIDQIKGRAAPTSKRQDAPKPYKLCQQCGKANPVGSSVCMACGAEFEKPASIVNLRASDAPILSDGQAPKPRLETFEVDRILAFPKKSKAGRDYLQIVYHCGLDRFTDALMLGADGRAGAMATMKWRHAVETADTVMQVPRNPGEAYRLLEEGRVWFRSVSQITVDMASKYHDIVKVG